MQLCVFKSDYDSPSPALSLPECSLCRFVNQPPHLAMGSLWRRSNPGAEASAVRHIQHTSPLIHREIGATFHLVFSQPRPTHGANGPLRNIGKRSRASPLIRAGCWRSLSAIQPGNLHAIAPIFRLPPKSLGEPEKQRGLIISYQIISDRTTLTPMRIQIGTRLSINGLLFGRRRAPQSLST